MIDKNANIIVLGGSGFLGHHVCETLKKNLYTRVQGFGRLYDFRNPQVATGFFENFKPDIVINAAATVGGIGYNFSNGYSLWSDNILIGHNVLDAAINYGKLLNYVYISTTCCYPKNAKPPFKEENLDSGRPEDTNFPYASAKRTAMVGLEAAYKQFGFKSVCLVPTNLLGPRDNFTDEKSHVIPNLVRKMVEAKDKNEDKVEVWGDGTGTTRDFLYVDDCAEGIMLGMEKITDSTAINLGSGVETSIKEVAEKIKELVGFSGELSWNASRPNGQPRRLLDITRAKTLLGWEPKTSLTEALQKTINYYRDEHIKPQKGAGK